jgi:hypothetical protein
MPPQQLERLLDLVDEILGFRAHVDVRFRLAALLNRLQGDLAVQQRQRNWRNVTRSIQAAGA